MVKLYCDRCNKEASKLNSVSIPEKKCYQSIVCKKLDLCKDCENEANEIFDTLGDIKIMMFSKYLKNGAERRKRDG